MRDSFLEAIAKELPDPQKLSKNVFVAIDGVDGSGKTRLAIDLEEWLASRGRKVVRASIDGFHNRKALRYSKGRNSARGFWLDSYDYDAFLSRFILPIKPGGSGEYAPAIHDVETDEMLPDRPLTIDSPSIIIVDGIFLHRDELRDIWDFTIFLDVDFEVSVARMAERDGSSAEVDAAGNKRYVDGQRIYLDQVRPASHADIVIQYNDLARPVLHFKTVEAVS